MLNAIKLDFPLLCLTEDPKDQAPCEEEHGLPVHGSRPYSL